MTLGGCWRAHFGFDETLISPASYRIADLRAPRSPLLTLRSEKLAGALGEALPGQADGHAAVLPSFTARDIRRLLRVVPLVSKPDQSDSGSGMDEVLLWKFASVRMC